ncbi:hypothetical protein [Mycobacterium sp. PSTR-4-N]|uniref:hypothetical protein n=1 Tax=Mycobacterium sp. PSTR-4-N TaxID=2917745 RepID=UPI001F153B72|nr:hypothetical protein [Mycobacterium sp. PSTR-4-N]MCG7596345.1 hypothetical protein [Mycobacterium sp. PSTR-4-N]
MTHVRIEIAGHVWFNGNIEGWEEPAVRPGQQDIKLELIPPEMREVLDKAMLKVLEERLGIKVTSYERVR